MTASNINTDRVSGCHAVCGRLASFLLSLLLFLRWQKYQDLKKTWVLCINFFSIESASLGALTARWQIHLLRSHAFGPLDPVTSAMDLPSKTLGQFGRCGHFLRSTKYFVRVLRTTSKTEKVGLVGVTGVPSTAVGSRALSSRVSNVANCARPHCLRTSRRRRQATVNRARARLLVLVVETGPGGARPTTTAVYRTPQHRGLGCERSGDARWESGAK